MTRDPGPRISVVVPNHNGAATIRTCIRSVLASTVGDLELIVVDDASSDDSAERVRASGDPRVRLLINGSNRGAAFSRNRGIREARGPIIFLLDADTCVDPDCLARHLRVHDRVRADLVAGGVQGIHRTVAGLADDCCNWWTSIPGSRSGFVNRLHVPTTNLSVKREVFDTAGFFREQLRYGEDSEFCHRVRRHGLRIYFQSDIVARHFDRDTLRGLLEHNYGWGTALVENRGRNRMEYSRLLPRGYLAAWLYAVPLAVLFTLFIVSRWLPHRPARVVLVSPLILLAKLWQTLAIKDSLRPGGPRTPRERGKRPAPGSEAPG